MTGVQTCALPIYLVDAALPHMSRFTSEHGWPLYLATLSYGAITIRHSTAPESPMAFEAAALNTRRSVLTSALGRVWLAFCPPEERLAMLRGKLLKEREKRIRPGLDDKVLADWNGLMIAALANAGALLGESGWIAMASG